MYQGPPTQSYNDFIMQQELHQRLNYGPTGGRNFNQKKKLNEILFVYRCIIWYAS
jgi:hypothetical protein